MSGAHWKEVRLFTTRFRVRSPNWNLSGPDSKSVFQCQYNQNQNQNRLYWINMKKIKYYDLGFWLFKKEKNTLEGTISWSFLNPWDILSKILKRERLEEKKKKNPSGSQIWSAGKKWFSFDLKKYFFKLFFAAQKGISAVETERNKSVKKTVEIQSNRRQQTVCCPDKDVSLTQDVQRALTALLIFKLNISFSFFCDTFLPILMKKSVSKTFKNPIKTCC